MSVQARFCPCFTALLFLSLETVLNFDSEPIVLFHNLGTPKVSLKNLFSSLRLYIKNARECLTMISNMRRHMKLFIALECFDIMVKHERKFLI